MELSGKVTVFALISTDDNDRGKCGGSVVSTCRYLEIGKFTGDADCILFGELLYTAGKKGNYFTSDHPYRCGKCLKAFGTGGE